MLRIAKIMMSIRSETDQGQSLETGSGNDTDLVAGRDTVQEVVTGNGRGVGAARDAAVVAETDTRKNTGTASQTKTEG